MTTTPQISQPKARIDLRLVVGLACLTLLFPILSVIVNVLGGSARTIGPAAAWIWLIVGAAWVLVVWRVRATRPVATLIVTGLAGGLLTVLVVGVIQLIASGSANLLTDPAALVALVALNVLGGLVCGLIAWGLQALTQRSSR